MVLVGCEQACQFRLFPILVSNAILAARHYSLLNHHAALLALPDIAFGATEDSMEAGAGAVTEPGRARVARYPSVLDSFL